MTDRLDRALADLPRAFPGPGGAAAVLRDGQVLARHAWGWANAELRIPFTPHSLFRMCSITKQFTCALALDLVADLAELDPAVRAALPLLTGAVPTAAHLAHNQSGLRDYWAVAMLQGAPATAPFGDAEARRLMRGARSLHFEPGTSYSYSNGNFRILSDILQDRTGRSFADLLRERVFARAGMQTAFLAADTRAMPDGTEGYEGTVEAGFRPAENRIVWTGDAGLGASLDDMIAWERFIDSGRDDPSSLPRRLSAPVAFADGTPAQYGFGLGHGTEFGHATIGHGGALRGWRSHRMYLPGQRVSVVVMLNHLSDARAAGLSLLAAVLDAAPPPSQAAPSQAASSDAASSDAASPDAALPEATLPPPDWLGSYMDAETGLSARIDLARPGQLRLRYGHTAERLDQRPDGTAANAATTLRPDRGGLRIDRPGENRSAPLHAVPGTPDPAGLPGRYRCAELDAELTLASSGGTLYGAFSGPLGQGRMECLDPVGPDVWTLPCPRALDHTPPGDWTISVRRDGASVAGLTVGCWLARNLSYAPLGRNGAA